MSNVSYLFIVVVVSIVGSLFLWIRHRKPRTFMSSIDDFQREMHALGGEDVGRGPSKIRPEPIVPAPEAGDLARKLKDARRVRGDGRRER